MNYFQIKSWNVFQQYKDRDPKWIKLYRSLNRNYEWCQLDEVSRAHLVGIWLLAAELDNKIPEDKEWLAMQIGAKQEVDLNQLVTYGFIEPYKPVQECTEVYESVPRDREETEKKGKENKFSEADLTLTKHIYKKILILQPKAKEPNFEKWADVIRLMREIDNRNHNEIKNTFNWANNDSFWQGNILSPAKLRQHFDRLEIQSKKNNNSQESSYGEHAL